MRPSVDNKEPKRFSHLNGGRGQLNASKQRRIDQENSMLLKKMLHIIKRKSHYTGSTAREEVLVPVEEPVISGLSQSMKSRPTNVNGAVSQASYQIDSSALAPQLHPLTGTLNYYQRKKEFENIQLANQQMVKTLRETKPSMKREEWKEHIKQYQKLKDQLNKRRNTAKVIPPQSSAQISDSLMLPAVTKPSTDDQRRQFTSSEQQYSRTNRAANGVTPSSLSRRQPDLSMTT